MKILSTLIIIMMLVSPAMATVEFPMLLDAGKYELVVPDGEAWTVRNIEAEQNVRKEFATIKLDMEEQSKVFEVELARLKAQQELELLKVNSINSIKLLYNEDKVKMLEEKLKQERRKGTFLGISTNYFSFIMGAVITGIIASGVK